MIRWRALGWTLLMSAIAAVVGGAMGFAYGRWFM